MKDTQVAILAGFTLAIGVGIGLGIQSLLSDEDGNERENTTPSAATTDQINSLKADLAKLQNANDKAEKELAERRKQEKYWRAQLDAQASEPAKNAAIDKSIDAAASNTGEGEQSVEAKNKESEFAVALKTMSLAERNALAKKLSTNVITMIDVGTSKQEVLAEYNKLLSMGVEHAEEIYKVFDQLYMKGNPFYGANELDFVQKDFYSILSNEMQNHALDNHGQPGVPESATVWSGYASAFHDRPIHERVERLMRIAGTSSSRNVQRSVFNAVSDSMASKDANGPLLEFALTGANDPELRVLAIQTLKVESLTEAQWQQLWTLANDASEEVQGAVAVAEAILKPSATGLMLTMVALESQAALAGMKVGDILVSYNGKPITTIQSLQEAKKEVANLTVGVTVMRAGKELRLTLNPGQIGINGKMVTKK